MTAPEEGQQSALEVLGLSALEARIFRTVMREEEVTSAALKAMSGSSMQSVMAAVDTLVKRRLVERLHDRRPQLVFLHAHARESVQQLVADAELIQQQRRSELERLSAAVELASRRRSERGRPRRSSSDEPPSPRGRTAHDEVLAASELGIGTASRSLIGCSSRLLITDADAEFDLAALADRQQPESEVRLSNEPLPAVRILDGERLMAVVGTSYGRGLGWSWDARHVRAAQELFELWWARAEPGFTKPHPPKEPEPEWDVEEWDPADL